MTMKMWVCLGLTYPRLQLWCPQITVLDILCISFCRYCIPASETHKFRKFVENEIPNSKDLELGSEQSQIMVCVSQLLFLFYYYYYYNYLLVDSINFHCAPFKI